MSLAGRLDSSCSEVAPIIEARSLVERMVACIASFESMRRLMHGGGREEYFILAYLALNANNSHGRMILQKLCITHGQG